MENCINNIEETECKVSISTKILQSPIKFAKTVNPLSTPSATHICDIESKEECYITKFKGVLEQLSNANKLVGRSFRYNLGYSNLAFELWIILHKSNCNGSFTNRTQYLAPINRVFNEKFESLKEYKQKDNFKRCLSKISFDDVKNAICRANKIMKSNAENGLKENQYKGFTYYSDNPSLTINKAVEKILKDCNLINL